VGREYYVDDVIKGVVNQLTERELCKQAYAKMFMRYLRHDNIKIPAGMIELGRVLVIMDVNFNELLVELIRQYKAER
jgi:hypothetical protein